MSETKSKNGFNFNAANLRAYTMIFALALIWVFFQWQTGGIFLSARNLSNLSVQTTVTGVLAVGMLAVIIAGQIDLSVGSVVGLLGGVAAIALMRGYGLAPALLAALVCGVAIGVINGALIAYINIPAFIVTLGGLLIWRGLLEAITVSNTIPIGTAAFKSIGQQYIAKPGGWILAGIAIAVLLALHFRAEAARRRHELEADPASGGIMGLIFPIAGILAFVFVMNSYAGVPIPAFIFIVVAILMAFILRATTFGRYLYAIGGNSDAARLSGININTHIVMVYVLLGVLTAVAAVVHTAREGNATPTAGVLFELNAIAACVIGGASLVGGRGTVFGACLGALIMQSLDNGMSLLNVRPFAQSIIKGLILVAAVGLDMVGRKK